jgi:hypothetical protein
MEINFKNFSQNICTIAPYLNKNNYFIILGAISMLTSLILLIILYFVICRKFDKVINGRVKNVYFIDLFFKFYGLPIYAQISRALIYSSHILYNYVARYKKI